MAINLCLRGQLFFTPVLGFAFSVATGLLRVFSHTSLLSNMIFNGVLLKDS